ncbi:MAG: response regulator [Desulfuromonadales bacterium]|nr:response regulator [Desulfuromonadales bacterium]
MTTTEKLRVIVIEDDLAMSDLFKKILQGFGCDVRVFSDPTACPVFRTPECDCPMDSACADVLISDVMMPNMNGIELFELQRKRGCKALDANKALISATRAPEILSAIDNLGCRFFRKPFKISDIKCWINECSERSAKAH